ncbi:MAG TPA: TonB-dependent receptor [Candidatus Krumholzibacteria bacterium]|nr:TonB-dependent receptor [Candidatus Krumholzibacteria bacterium]
MPNTRARGLLLGLFALACGGTTIPAARAADADSTTGASPTTVDADSTGDLVAPVLEVRGRRITAQGRVDRDTGFASVLEASSWRGESYDTAEVLSRAVGVHVRDSGGVGGHATVSLRGSTPAQVPIYLDGVLLNGPDSGAVDLADLHLAHLERIEVYRGSAPLVLGGGSLGGAIHLYSLDGRESWNGSLTRGSFDTWNAEGGGAWRLADWSVAARGRFVRSENDWDYLDDRRTPYNPDDDRVVGRVNNDATGFGGQLQLSRPAFGGTLRLSEILDTREQGLPGRGVLQSETARSRSLTHHAQIAWRSERRARGVLREVSLHQRTERQAVRDLGGDLSGTPRDRVDVLHAVGLNASGAARPFGPTVWNVQSRVARLRSVDEALLDGEGEPQWRWTTTAALEPKWRVLGDRLLLSPGVRVEHHEQWWNESSSLESLPRGDEQRTGLFAYTAQFGTRYAISDEVSLKANLGVYRRVPTLLELFGDRGTTTANPDLRPEEGVNRDVGLVWSRPLEGRRFALSAFANDAFDLITFVKTSPVTARARNLGRAEIRGLEFEADFGRFGPFGFRAAITRLWSEDRTDDTVAGGKQLPFRPGIEVELQQSLHVGHLRADFDLFAMGENYQQTGERLAVPARVIGSIGLRWRLSSDWALHGRVDNVSDAEVHDFLGDPLPGRQVSLSLQAGGR